MNSRCLLSVHADLMNLESYGRMEIHNPLEISVINLRSDFSLIVGFTALYKSTQIHTEPLLTAC